MCPSSETTTPCAICDDDMIYEAGEYYCLTCGSWRGAIGKKENDILLHFSDRKIPRQGDSPWQVNPPKQNKCSLCEKKVSANCRKELRPTGPCGKYQQWPICDDCLEIKL